jgi:hypothetical protein
MCDVTHELIKAIVQVTEAAGLWDQPRFLSAIGMPESWIGIDVPPIIRTILSWNFPVMIPDREMESSDEGIEVF